MLLCHHTLQNQLNYGENIDVVAYVNGKRETYNPPGRAHAPVVWDYYQVSLGHPRHLLLKC